MKFTGVYATYYQDICKQFDKVVAKCKNLEKSKPELQTLFSDIIKSFNKRVDDFNGTTLVNDSKVLVNGVTKYVEGSSETILQIQCITTLKDICFKATERYYAHSYYSDITSWEDYDALFKEIEKEYGFIQEMLKLFIAERKIIKANALGAINVAVDLRKLFEHTKKICLDGEAAVIRRRGLPKFKYYSGISVQHCSEWFRKGSSIINYRPYHL